MILASFIDVATVKPALEIADIFRLHFNDYLQVAHCTPEEMKAAQALMHCRTALLGGHVRVCDSCGKLQIAYDSCNNRACPKCGAFAKAQWLAKQSFRLLPVPHFHVVFTVDHLINDIAYVNQQEIYDLLFRVAGRVLKEFTRKYLGGVGGATMALHTWGQTLQHHIHLHCMVPSGALVETADGYVWRKSAPKFLFPAEEFSAEFRKAFCKGLRRLWRAGKLRLVGECANTDVDEMLKVMESKKWEVFIGAPPANAKLEDLLGYLSRYVYRTAITNQRLVKLADGKVTFEYFDNRERDAEGQGKKKVMALPAVEFIGRFLRHVLPFQYKRVRHFGLYAGGKLWLQAVRMLVSPDFDLTNLAPPKLDLGEWLKSLGVEDALRCPFCGQGTMQLVRNLPPIRGYLLWLLALLGLPILGKEAEA